MKRKRTVFDPVLKRLVIQEFDEDEVVVVEPPVMKPVAISPKLPPLAPTPSTAPTTAPSVTPVEVPLGILTPGVITPGGTITMDEAYFKSVELPEETESYKPVSHAMVIDNTKEMLGKAGFVTSSIIFSGAKEGQEMSAFFILEPKDEDDPWGSIIAVQNSYNKRIALKYAYGVGDDKIQVLTGDITFRRKHTGSVVDDFEEVLDKSIVYLTDTREQVFKAIDMMNFTTISKKMVAELIGRMVFEEHILTSKAINDTNRIVKKLFKKTDRASLWDIYCRLSDQLKTSKTADQIDHFINTFKLITNTYGII